MISSIVFNGGIEQSWQQQQQQWQPKPRDKLSGDNLWIGIRLFGNRMAQQLSFLVAELKCQNKHMYSARVMRSAHDGYRHKDTTGCETWNPLAW